jgi:iron only hydrogenase large subunit-like protein
MANPLLSILPEKCIMCLACVRICPVKAIKVDAGKGNPSIIPQRCIGCGSCYRVCSSDAIEYRSSVAETIDLLKSGENVAAICDPAISGEFVDITDYRKFVEMIRQLGFTYVHEVSFGADMVAGKYRQIIDHFQGKYYITSNCPAVVAMIEKYHPELITNLTPLVSPMIATAKMARKKNGKDVRVVFIGPCIAAKEEALRYDDDGKVDSVLTFTELRQLFKDFNIRESQVEYSEFDSPLGYKGSLYPLSNGIIQAAGLSEDLLDGKVITAEGRNNMLNAIGEFDKRIDLIKRNFNIFYNEGCLMGPGTSPEGEKFLRRTMVTDYADKRLKGFDNSLWLGEMDFFSDLDLSREFTSDDQRLPLPSDEEIKEVLNLIGKGDQLDNDIGCESCGYSSCYDFAVAVAQGLATTDMCQTYSTKNRQDYIKNLRTANEKLAKTQDALKESEEKAQRDREAEKESSETLDAMMQKLISGVVIVDDNLKIVHSNKAFIHLLGEDAKLVDEVIPGLVGADLKTLLPVPFYQLFSYVMNSAEDILNRDVHYGNSLLNVSVFAIKRSRFVGGIIRDIYSPEVRKEHIMRRLSEVIDENFVMVQKITSILGEGAAKTEIMLNSLIESYQTQKKKPGEGSL